MLNYAIPILIAAYGFIAGIFFGCMLGALEENRPDKPLPAIIRAFIGAVLWPFLTIWLLLDLWCGKV